MKTGKAAQAASGLPHCYQKKTKYLSCFQNFTLSSLESHPNLNHEQRRGTDITIREARSVTVATTQKMPLGSASNAEYTWDAAQLGRERKAETNASFFLESTLFGKIQKLTTNSQPPTSFSVKKGVPRDKRAVAWELSTIPGFHSGSPWPDRPSGWCFQRQEKKAKGSSHFNTMKPSWPSSPYLNLPTPTTYVKTVEDEAWVWVSHTYVHRAASWPKSSKSPP